MDFSTRLTIKPSKITTSNMRLQYKVNGSMQAIWGGAGVAYDVDSNTCTSRLGKENTDLLELCTCGTRDISMEPIVYVSCPVLLALHRDLQFNSWTVNQIANSTIIHWQ